MGREVRKVPVNWVHPKNERGQFTPLFECDLTAAQAEWDRHCAKWIEGLRDDWHGGWKPLEGDELKMPFEEWDGGRPDPADYMPQWSDAEKTHLMMYETCTEGTPISPTFSTPEELAQWLADNSASSFADITATYDQWLKLCTSGACAISCVVSNGEMKSGVQAL